MSEESESTGRPRQCDPGPKNILPLDTNEVQALYRISEKILVVTGTLILSARWDGDIPLTTS